MGFIKPFLTLLGTQQTYIVKSNFLLDCDYWKFAERRELFFVIRNFRTCSGIIDSFGDLL